MTRTAARLALLLLFLAAAAVAQPGPVRELRGQVYHLGGNGEKVFETGIIITWQETGNSDDTNDQGIFRLPIPPAFQPGDKATLSLDKPGWRIRYPLDGEARIPASTGKEIVEVELLPAGSKLFWTHDRIEKFIHDLAEKSKSAARASEKKADRGAEFGRYIQEWAVRYGFTPQDAQKEIDRWIADTEANQEDVYKLGLAAFAKKNFADAARHFRDSADWRARQLEETRRRQAALAEREKQLREELVRDLELEGESYYQEGDYRKALAVFEEAHGHTSRDETPELWATTLLDTALVHESLGAQGPAAESAAHLEQAVRSHREALLVLTRERFPRQWALVQNYLGNALHEQAARAGGERGAQLLSEAVEVYRQALLIRTREQFPEDWATTHDNLGNTLTEQAMRTAGKRGMELLAEAVESYRRALLIRTREQLPQEWAMTQNNLGVALSEQGTRTVGQRGAELLAEAAEVLRQALLVRTREQFPQYWAMTQNNLGATLLEEGMRTAGQRGVELLAEAAEVFRQTLSVYTREQLPQDWATIQNNLGNALAELAARTEGQRGAELLSQAVEAYRQALLVRTREQLPQPWARTQHNLGLVLQELGMRTEGQRRAELLAEAVEVFGRAREALSQEPSSPLWLLVRRNEVRALYLSGRRHEAAKALSEVLAHNPDESGAFSTLVVLLNDELFDPAGALKVSREWLGRHPGDPLARTVEIEALFASGAYADCKEKAASFLTVAGLSADHRTVLLGYEAAAGMASGSPDAGSALERLVNEVAAQPAGFKTGSTFPAALHSLQKRPDLPHRDWLVRFFKTLESPDRDSILQGLRALQAGS